MTPQITIIIPTFNPGDKLRLSLESVRAQDFEALEIWVMDGASSDGTAQWLAQNAAAYGFRWQSEPDAGVYDAMNRGAARATGEFLYFLGAGDLVRPGALRKVAARMAPRGEQLLLIYGDMSLPDGTRYDGPFTRSKLRTENIGHQAIFYDRRLFERFKGYESRYRSFADHAFNMKCWGCSDVVPIYCDLIIAEYEGGGLSNAGDPVFDRERMRLVKQHLGIRQYFLALIAKLLPAQLKLAMRRTSRQSRARHLSSGE